MATTGGNILGSIQIVITGDSTQLAAALASAQAMAQKAGTAISSSLGSGLNQSSASTANLSSEINRLITAMAEQNAQLSLSIQRNVSLAGAARATGSAMAHSVSEIQAAGAAIRVGFGDQSIRAVERLLTMIPGIGSALQAIFPIIGALALVEMFGKVAEKLHLFGMTSKEVAEEVVQMSKTFAGAENSLAHLHAELISIQSGKLAGLKFDSLYGDFEAKRDQQNIDSTNEKIGQAAAKLSNWMANGRSFFGDIGAKIAAAASGAQDLADKLLQQRAEQKLILEQQQERNRILDEEKRKTGASDAGSIASARIANEEKATARLNELHRLQTDIWIASEKSAALSVIDAVEDVHERAVEIAKLDVQLAIERAAKIGAANYAATESQIDQIKRRASAEAAGKSPVEATRIGIAATGEIAEKRSERDQKELELHKAVLDASGKVDEALAVQQRAITEEIIKDGQKRVAAINREVEAIVSANERYVAMLTRVQEIQQKSAGVKNEAGIIANKLALERAYGLEVVHTGAQQLEHMRQIDALEEKARLAKIAGLTAAANTAKIAGDLARSANLTAEAEALTAENANKVYDAKTKELEAQQKLTLQYKLQHAFANAAGAVPGAIGGAIASGVFGGHKGQSVGQEITTALKGIGQQLFGNVLTHLITTVIANTVGQTALGALLGLNATATTVNTGSTLANTISTVWATISTDAQTIATWALVAIQTVKAFLGFADGGRPPVGVPSMVGERGPELFIPDQAGRIIPAGQFGGSGLHMPGGVSSSSSNSVGSVQFNFNAHGVNDPRELTRQVAHFLKSAGGPRFAALSK